MDLVGYDKYLTGQLVDHELPQEDIERFLEPVRHFPKPQLAEAAPA
jgi:hypothetical protein